MVPISGRPIIDRQLEWLAHSGVTQCVVSAGHQGERLAEHLKGQEQPCAIRLVTEDEPLGRGGELRHASDWLPRPDRPWFAVNGDLLTDLDLVAMERWHNGVALATVGLVRPTLPWGVAKADESWRITSFMEGEISPDFVNAGVYIFYPEARDLLPDRGDHERSTFPLLARRGHFSDFRPNVTGAPWTR